jgi:lysophospholipase L1-like esterase
MRKSRRQFLVRSVVAAGATTVSVFAGDRSQAGDVDPSRADGYRYRLPKSGTGSRLLFQGDSITDMQWGRNEKDRNHYLGHSYVFLIAARLGVDLPSAGLDIYNRGMSGHTVGDLRGRWQKTQLI